MMTFDGAVGLLMKRLVAVSSISSFLVFSSLSLADGTTSITNSTAFSGLAAPGTGAFQGASGGGITANINQCFGLTGGSTSSSGANSILGVTIPNKKGGTGGCGTQVVPDIDSLSCDSSELQTNGNFDPQKLETQLESLSALDGGSPKGKDAKNPSLTCSLNQFTAVKNEIQCVQQQGQLLTQQIGALSAVYQQNIQRFQKDQQSYMQREGDRQTQLDTIQKLLGGNGDSGTKGLLKEQADMQALVNTTMPQDIAAAQAQSKTVANQRAIITQNIQKHTLSLTGDCFKNQPKPGYKCSPGGPDLSPENYIACMYGKYAHVVGGIYQTGAASDQNAQAAQNTIQSILDQMYSQTSLSWTAPTDAASAQAAGSRPNYGNTLQDLENNFIGKMSGMTVNGISVATVVTSELQTCYANAQSEVQTERTDPSSTIGQAEFQQTQNETALKATFDQKLETYTEKWTEAMGVLTAQNLPLNLTQCKSQDITYEGNCLTDVQNQVTSLLKGDNQATPYTMNVPSQFPDTQIPTTALQCRGLNGCVTQMQAVQQSVSQAKTQLVTSQQSYDQQARQTTEQFTSQMAQLMSAQSSQLRTQLSNINSTLQGLGVSSNISFPNVQGEDLQYDGTGGQGDKGLPQMPKSVMALIGGKMNPPMMDLTDNSGNDASAIAEQVSKVKQKMQDVGKVRTAWKQLNSKCGVEDINSSFESQVSGIVADCSDRCQTFVDSGMIVKAKCGPNSGANCNGDSYVVTGDPTSTLLQIYESVAKASNVSLNSSSGSADADDSDADVGPDTDNGKVSFGSIKPTAKARNTEINSQASIFNNLLNGCASKLANGGGAGTCNVMSGLSLSQDKGHRGTGSASGGDSAAAAQ